MAALSCRTSAALERGRGRRPAEPERGRGAETRRRGCRLDGKLMFTAESTQRFQGEGRRARPGGPGGWTGREPGFCGAHDGAEARRVGAATKLAARAGRACPAPPGPKFPEAGTLLPWALGRKLASGSSSGVPGRWRDRAAWGCFLTNPVGDTDLSPLPSRPEVRSLWVS